MKTLLNTILLSILVATTHFCLADEQTPKYYLANWDSLRNYQVPEWYYDAKFGIWPIWGPYSVTEYRGTHCVGWYPRWMFLIENPANPFNSYDQQGAAIAKHHIEKYGEPAKFGYHDFIPMFKAEKWDPDQWADFAIDCGAKFFTVLSEFHDGFAMYDSGYTQWDSADMGPKRDVTGELAKATRKRGLKFGVSNHLALNPTFYQNFFKNGFDKIHFKNNPELAGLYSNGKLDDEYIKRWWDRTTELAKKYNPDLYYFDWCWNGAFWDNERPEFCSFFYNHAIRTGKGRFGSPEVVINYKNSSVAKGCAVLDLERGSMKTAQNFVWQTDTAVGDHSWAYSATDKYKSAKELITMLTDIVSKNGILMLAFGPKADGTIPEEHQEPMLEMGKWLKANGQAIYATRPWKVAAEGPTDAGGHGYKPHYTAKDIRYTQSKDGKTIYATSFGFPKGKLTLQSTKVISVSDNAKITMLANGKNIPFELSDRNQLVLDLSKIKKRKAGCQYAYSFAIEGIEIQANELSPIDLSETYMYDVKDYDPLGKNFNSQYPYLSAVEPVIVKAHSGVKRDTNYRSKGLIKIGGKEYKHGLMLCPSGDGNRGFFIIKMDKLPKVKGFSAEIGIDDAMSSAGNCAFIVESYADGKWQPLYKSKVLTYKDDPVKIDVAFPSDAEFIRLVTTDGGNGCSADHAVWADAKFTE